jgi:replicative DNA helicase
MNNFVPTANLLTDWAACLFDGQPPRCFEFGLPIKIREGTLTVFGAEPGKGKTSLCCQMMFEAIYRDSNVKVVFASAEMTWQEIIIRELARLSGVNLSVVDGKQWTDDQKSKIATAYKRILSHSNQFTFVPSPMDLRSIEKVVVETEADLLLIDYLQLIHADNDDRQKDKRSQVDQVLEGLKQATNHGLTVIAICKLNRMKDRNNNANDVDWMGRLAESSSIEYQANNIYFLDDYPDEPFVKILIDSKGRSRQTGNITLRFDGSCQRWSPWEGE